MYAERSLSWRVAGDGASFGLVFDGLVLVSFPKFISHISSVYHRNGPVVPYAVPGIS